jgi:hypothetical protein
MGPRGMHARFWWKSQMERDHKEDLDVGRRKILKWILEKEYGLVRTGLILLRMGTSDEPSGSIKCWESLE